ncbi:uncharacterized protein LOC126901115 [Daktulosphaira vitifoliae]|uniref:uncharacterized protein LOC126901115 n=1 Tax=Daktulosphaira vitifoliae TaxID=58002 RepID=UPI0021AAF2FD|nr:uncharacterized protein LOC126901115 [Daktulosphaira vitifoliae]
MSSYRKKNIMSNKNDEKFINYRLFKILKLNRSFNPFNLDVLRKLKYYQFLYGFVLLLEIIIINCCLLKGFYYVINDIATTVQLFLSLLCTISTNLNTFTFSQHFNDFWKLFRIMRNDFLSYMHNRKDIFQQYQTKCILITNIYIFVYFFTGLSWIFNSLFIKEFHFKTRNDVKIIYRNNIFNLYFSIMPISLYNKIFPVVYIAEFIVTIHTIFDLFLKNLIVMQFCWMISAKLRTIASMYETFGYNVLVVDEGPIRNKIEDPYVEVLELITMYHIKLIKFLKIMMCSRIIFWAGAVHKHQ